MLNSNKMAGSKHMEDKKCERCINIFLRFAKYNPNRGFVFVDFQHFVETVKTYFITLFITF